MEREGGKNGFLLLLVIFFPSLYYTLALALCFSVCSRLLFYRRVRCLPLLLLLLLLALAHFYFFFFFFFFFFFPFPVSVCKCTQTDTHTGLYSGSGRGREREGKWGPGIESALRAIRLLNHPRCSCCCCCCCSCRVCVCVQTVTISFIPFGSMSRSM